MLHKHFISWFFIIITSCALWGCGGSSPAGTATVTGSVVAGPTSGASVTVKTAAGTVVAGPVTTAADGSYSIPIPTSALAGDLIFEATGGVFTDEATGTAGVTLGTLTAHAAANTLTAGSKLSLDPSSTIIQKLIAGGLTRSAAEGAFNTAFGYTPDSSVAPAFANVSSAATISQRLAGVRTAAFSQLTKELFNDPTKQFILIQALADDLSDGVLDGKKNGTGITVSGIALPADIAGLSAKALAIYLNGNLNKSKLSSAPFAAAAITPSYKVEYLPGTAPSSQGKTSFRIRVTNRSDNTPAAGKSVSLTPIMHMPSMTHSTPFDAVVDNGDGTYSVTVYYLMASGPGMGYWELKVAVGSETACFYPSVAMAMGSTNRATLKGISDTYAGMMGAAKRSYYLFNDGVIKGTTGTTLKLFIAAADDSMMLDYPAVSGGSTLHDKNGAAWTVSSATTSVTVSTDGGATWTAATDNGSGHWSVAELSGLSSGGTALVRLTVNGEQKTTDGLAASGANGYATFTIIAGM